MQEQMREYDVVIMSYDILRNDIDQLKAFTFNYCVLDEVHTHTTRSGVLAPEQLRADN
jgi:SNF2 family DNA or RNA helicase